MQGGESYVILRVEKHPIRLKYSAHSRQVDRHACDMQGGVVFAVCLVQQRGTTEEEVPVSAIVRC